MLSLDVDSLQKVKLTPNPSARPFFYHGQYTAPTALTNCLSLNTHFHCNQHFAVILVNTQFYLQELIQGVQHVYNFGCGQTFLTKIKSEILHDKLSQIIAQIIFVLEDELDFR